MNTISSKIKYKDNSFSKKEMVKNNMDSIEGDIIQLAVALDCKKGLDNYIKYAATLIASILVNTKRKLKIHVFCYGNLPQMHAEKLSEFVKSYNQQIIFYELDIHKVFMNLTNINQWSPVIVSKFYVAEIIEADKLIFLDLDIILNQDIEKLWDVNLQKFAFAGVSHHANSRDIVKSCEYYDNIISVDEMKTLRVNAGVLIFNLKRIREKYNMLDSAILFFSKYNNGMGIDEDFFVYLFREDLLKLPIEYNYSIILRFRFEAVFEDIICFHYDSKIKPLNYVKSGDLQKMYWEYFYITPYFTKDSFTNLLIGIKQEKDNYGAFLRQIRKGKKIVVWGAGELGQQALKILELNFVKDYFIDKNYLFLMEEKGKNDKWYLDIKSPEVLRTEDRSRLIIVIAVYNYGEVFSYLETEFGLKKNIDVFHIYDFI